MIINKQYFVLLIFAANHKNLAVCIAQSIYVFFFIQTEIESCRIVSSVSDTITSVFVYQNRFTSLQSRNDFGAIETLKKIPNLFIDK